MIQKLLKEYGFKSPRSALADSAAQAKRLAAEIGFPVALKIVSPDILHKTDVGGVVLGCRTGQEVGAAFRQIRDSVKRKCPQAKIEGIAVEEMCLGGQEIIIGLIDDPQFGPSIMFGVGGILVELIEDVAFRVLPIDRNDAHQMIDEIKGRRLLDGYRGLPPVSREMVVDLLMNAGRMGMALVPHLESVDLNPVLVWQDRHRVLDAKFIPRETERGLSQVKPNVKYLDRFFDARSVALVGASATPGKIGTAVLESLARHEYKGKVYPINPNRDELMGIKTYPSLKDAPGAVDLAVATVPLSSVPNVMVECAAKGVHNLVIVSGGGKELGDAGREAEATIARLAKEHELRTIGPNCIGISDSASRLDTFFQVHERMVRPPKGPIAIVTQSGTVGAAVLEKAENLGVTKFVSYGNRVDVDEADLIAFLADDPETRVIVCYVEGLADGRKFLNAARQVARRKPIVVMKGGRSKRGARASVSHTGFFGGTFGVFKGAMKQAGVVMVDSIEELYAAAEALALQPRARGSRVAMISNGAGTMVQAIDLLEGYNLEMAALDPATISHLRAAYPPFYVVQNPVDVTGSATADDYQQGIQALLQDPGVDIVMPWFVFQDTPLGESIVDVLGSLSHAYGKPILCGGMGGPYTRRMSEAIRAKGVPIYGTVREWVAAAKGLAGQTAA